ncbi:TonB-dependent receptor [Dyadobacter sp. 3J3]|uniref:SusC/RagA family TonB-linked outer membrane protein n=1 Tax=Dyadobacter sp. 3J3 TaxID=2606600 RepID=UPI001E4CD3E5|nr:TonB-dependent receptor [Dyadobacter sp. 3J3]
MSPSADNPVKGRITDEKGQSLVGVNVVVKGTSTGTTSNVDGKYELINVTVGQVLVFSFIGYIQQEIKIQNQTSIDIQLLPNSEQLNEVVVVGYGTVQKKDLTGAVGSISGKDIEQGAINTPDKALQGKIAGVQVHTNSHAPGGGISVQVRGTASLSAGGSPLYVIDGMPISNGFQTGGSSDAGSFGGTANPMNSIDPSDIESIQVLKDASASAIYGSRAANGVVLITTKRGKSGQQRTDLEYSFGLQTIRKKLDFMDATQWATQVNERASLLGQSQVYTPQQVSGFGKGTNWQNEIYQSAPKQTYKLSFSGGSQNVRYMLAENVTLQQGIIPGSGFKRYGTSINVDADVSKKLRVGQSLMFTLTDEKVVPTDTKGYEGISNIVDAIYEAPPTIPARDELGQINNLRNFPMGGGLENPLTMTEKYREVNNTMRILGNIYADYNIIPGLDLNIRFGADIRDWKFHQYFPIGSEAAAGTNGKARQIGVRNLNYTNANTLTYSKTFNNIHQLKVLGGFTYQKEKNETMDASSFGFPSDIFEYYNLGLGSSPQTPGSNMNEWTLISYLGRVNYSLKDKYLFTASVRADGSSKFGANNKFGVFPAVAFGWQLGDEKFIQKLDVFDQLKLRASYGKTGNEAIGVYRSLSLLGTSFGTRSSYIYGGGKVPIAYPSNIANPDLSWEKTGEFNVGLDAGVLNGRLSFSVDYYHKKTTDLLLDVPIPSQTGFGSVLKNTGAMLNKGFEFGINSVNTSGKLNWTTNFNISFNRNKILSLGGAEYLYTGWVGGANVNPHAKNTVRLQPGHSVGEFYGSVFDGIWRSQEQIKEVGTMPAAKPGDIRYKDVNGDGTYDTEKDDVFLGSPLPKFSYGLTNDLSFGPLSLHVFLYGDYGNKVLNLAAQQYVLDGIGVSAKRLDRWTPEKPDNPLPAASATNPQRVSSYLIEDGSFLRVQNVTLSYKIPGFIKFVKNAKLGFGIDNLALLTKYSGYEPEVNSFGGSNTTKGMDRFGYPSSRTYRLEIKLGF